MKKYLFSIISFLFLFLPFAGAQMLNVELQGQKDCGFESYCVDIMLQAATDAYPEIGNASILLEYNERALAFESYTPANFHASVACAAGLPNGWQEHRFDAASRPGAFSLVLLFDDDGASCQQLSNQIPTAVGTVCFDIIQQGGDPLVNVAEAETYFNNNATNNGSARLPFATTGGISDVSLLACDCDGEGQACDDQNVYTVNDRYNINCECEGEVLDSDQDGIPDAIDACLDEAYEAEEATVIINGLVRNNQAQYYGDGFVDYQTRWNDTIQFTVEIEEAGIHQLGFRYALNSGNRWLQAEVDGAIVVPQLDFPETGEWHNWETVTFDHDFTLGTHTISLITNGSHGPNLDQMIVSSCTSCTLSGQPCDDGNLCTTDDVYDANCNCQGRYEDTDNDGVCDVLDTCPEGMDDLDEDGDGLPDACDSCNDNLIGQACDDGDPCTNNDQLDANCNCVGIADSSDSDGDGVCDAFDVCPGSDDHKDDDHDGIPNECDTCDDRLIGKPCDDGNPCTILDKYTPDCGCVGILMDNDGDGVCNWDDICDGYDDHIDTDNDGQPDGCDPNVGDITTIRIETGVIPAVGENWQTIQLEKTYRDMVVVATPHLNDQDYQPVVTRIKNTTETSFDIRIQVPGGSTADTYPVYFMVAEAGVYTEEYDGVNMEVHKFSSAYTSEDANWWSSRQSIDYENTYQQPIVIGQVMSYNDPRWSVFYASGSSSSSPPDNADLYISKHVGEDAEVDRVNEMLGYIVIEAGNYELGTIPFEAGITENTIAGLSGSSTFMGYNHDTNLPNANGAVFAIAGINGGNGGWPVLYGRTPILDGSLKLIFDEDQLYDEERGHTSEEVAYLAFYEADNCLLEMTTSSVDAECFDQASGATFVEIQHAAGWPTYEWSNGTQTANNEAISAGTYQLTVTDANGCRIYDEVTIDQPTDVEAIVNVIHNECYDGAAGAIELQVSGGVAPYEYAWSTGDVQPNITGLSSGTYKLTITDANGCEELAGAIITEPEAMSLEISRTPDDQGDGTVVVNVNGGTPPYQFVWSNGATAAAQESLASGVYELTVTDAAGCQLVEAIEIHAVPRLEAGMLEVTENWQTVQVNEDFETMVVVTTVQQVSLDDEPVVVRIKDVTNNSFDIRIQNPGGTTQKVYNVQYLATEAGVYTEELHGINMEAVFMDADETASTAGWTIEKREYQNTYQQPVVLGQVMSHNDPRWSSFWASHEWSRSLAPSATRIGVGKHAGADPDPTRASEKLGVIIFEAGSYDFAKYSFEVGLSADNISGVQGTSSGYAIPLSLESTDHAILATAGLDGGDGGWPVLYGSTPFGTNEIIAAFDEDQMADSERSHTTEEIAYLALKYNHAAQYCEPLADMDNYAWIEALAISGNLVNSTGNDGGYGNYLNKQANFTKGSLQILQCVPGFIGSASPKKWNVYIDYNQDNDFDDANELVIALGASTNFVSGSFITPQEALAGTTRMRIVMNDADNMNVCVAGAGGEIEDYTVVIHESSGLQAPLQNTLSQSDQMEVELRPNPVSDVLQLRLYLPQRQEASLRILDLNGRTVFELEADMNMLEDLNIPVSLWTNGTYIVHLVTEDQAISKRFVKVD